MSCACCGQGKPTVALRSRDDVASAATAWAGSRRTARRDLDRNVAGVVDAVLQTAERHRGMTLNREVPQRWAPGAAVARETPRASRARGRARS